MHLTRWAAADPRFPIPHLLEKCAHNRGQGDRGAERRAAGACAWSLRGRCSGVGEHQVCVGRSRRVCPQSLCAGRGCRKCFGARAAPRGRSEEGCVRELFAHPASPGPGVQRSCPPPPTRSARPAPTSASRLFLVPGSQGRRSPGNPAGTAPPGRRCSLPRPRRRLSGAHPASQRGAGAAGRGECGVGLRCGGLGPCHSGTWGVFLRPPRLRPRASPLLGNSLPLASSGAGGAGTEGVRSPFPWFLPGVSLPNPYSSQYLWSRKQLPSSGNWLRSPPVGNPFNLVRPQRQGEGKGERRPGGPGSAAAPWRARLPSPQLRRPPLGP